MTAKLTAAFMAIGLIQAPNQLQVQDAWANGQLELIDSLTHYAEYSWALADAAFKLGDGAPGVVQYEVDEDFGVWFGEQILEWDGAAPEHEECCIRLRETHFMFWNRPDDRTAAQAVLLGNALTAVPLPAAP